MSTLTKSLLLIIWLKITFLEAISRNQKYYNIFLKKENPQVTNFFITFQALKNSRLRQGYGKVKQEK